MGVYCFKNIANNKIMDRNMFGNNWTCIIFKTKHKKQLYLHKYMVKLQQKCDKK